MKMFSADFFAANRQALIAKLPAGAVVALAGHGEMQRSHDMAYEFEQEASFWYLCGINAPDWHLLIEADKTTLVAPNINATRQVFDGSLSVQEAQRLSGADEVIGLDELPEILARWHTQKRLAHTQFPDAHIKKYAHFTPNPAPARLLRQLKKRFSAVVDCRQQIQQLRTIKQPPEIEAIEAAINITATAFGWVRDRLADYQHEYEVEAAMTYELRRRGAAGHAYTPIVASGLNACTLHYVRNDAPLADDALLLIDVGARFNGYAADITRTYGRRLTQRQRDVYQAVQEAQQACIELIRPGMAFAEYQQKTDAIMQQAVTALGLPASRWRDYFPHAIGHGLGLDVHDALAGYEALTPGMVLTVEPGIYLPDEAIGVRIEDDILVTDNGYRNLSHGISRELG